MKRVLFAVLVALSPSRTLAQTPSLVTPTGHAVKVSVGSYTYVEPGTLRISIHGAKFAGEYEGTFPLDRRRRWFARVDARGTVGRAAYDGWCLPWLIRPNGASPNGWELDLGDASPCGETGDQDWYGEGRGLVGKDFVGDAWAFSPETGVGIRHLSNGTAGIPGYRTDDYLYVPAGLTARTRAASRSVLSLNVEYDRLLRGWQTTRNSAFGSGVLPATSMAPAFSIDGFTDIAFTQHDGWALRASAKWSAGSSDPARQGLVGGAVLHPLARRASPVNTETITFTVNGMTAREQFGAYEPVNFTNEFGVKLGFRF